MKFRSLSYGITAAAVVVSCMVPMRVVAQGSRRSVASADWFCGRGRDQGGGGKTDAAHSRWASRSEWVLGLPSASPRAPMWTPMETYISMFLPLTVARETDTGNVASFPMSFQIRLRTSLSY